VTNHAALRKSLARLKRVGVIPGAALALEKRLPSATRAVRDAILTQVPTLSGSASSEIRSEWQLHNGEHLREILRLLADGDVGDFDFVRKHARVCAEQQFPLEAALHAYRCSQQHHSRWIRTAAAAVAPRSPGSVVSAITDFGAEYANLVSTTMAAQYVAHTRQIAEAEGDRRADLLSALLNGPDESDARLSQLLRREGYMEPRQTVCVAMAQSADPLGMQNGPRAQRIVEAIAAAVAGSQVRALVGLRSNIATAVFADMQRQSGWTRPLGNLADKLRPLLLVLGPAVLIGLSRAHASIALIPKALQEATIALGCAHDADRVVSFGQLPMRRLLLHRSGDYLRTALPPWAPDFLNADFKARGALTKTLRAYGDADMNLIRAARALKVHPNTLYARMARINALTGLNSQRYHDLTELLLAADCQER